MSEILVNTIKKADGTGSITVPSETGTVLTSASDIPAANLTGSLPAGMGGKVLQAVSATKTDTSSTTGVGWVDITGLSVSITPTSASSKFLIFYNLEYGTYSTGGFYCRLLRDGTPILLGDAAGSRVQVSNGTQYSYTSQSLYSAVGNYLDSPSATSAIVYKLQFQSYASGLVYINRTPTDTDRADYIRAASTITVMEIAG